MIGLLAPFTHGSTLSLNDEGDANGDDDTESSEVDKDLVGFCP